MNIHVVDRRSSFGADGKLPTCDKRNMCECVYFDGMQVLM
jgi:hypothetical protein